MPSSETLAIWGAIAKALGMGAEGYVEGQRYKDQREDKEFEKKLALQQNARARAESDDRRTIDKYREGRLQKQAAWDLYGKKQNVQKKAASDILAAMSEGMGIPLADPYDNTKPEYGDREVLNILKTRQGLMEDLEASNSNYDPNPQAAERITAEIEDINEGLIALSQAKGKLSPGVKARFERIVQKISPKGPDSKTGKRDTISYFKQLKGKNKIAINHVLKYEFDETERKQVFDYFKTKAYNLAKSGKNEKEIREYLLSYGINPDQLLRMYNVAGK